MKEQGETGPQRPFLSAPLPAVHDMEGERVPKDLPPVVDAHVHLFPPRLFQAIWSWFDKYGWPVRYRLGPDEILRFLKQRGVRHVVGLQYAHRPGVARELNANMASLAQAHPFLTGLATVFPGEPEADAILKEGFEMGLKGVKLHAHVQCFEMLSPAMQLIYEICESFNKPLVIHAGREPKSPAYSCDPHLICRAEYVEEVLKSHPHLKVCVPHLGADELEAYAALVQEHDNLWLDTTMMLAEYFPGLPLPKFSEYRLDRLMYGTDFPNIPYAWDRELKKLAGQGLAEEQLALVLSQNACTFFGLHL